MSEGHNNGGSDAVNLDIARAAKAYQERGFGLVKLKPGGKQPVSEKGWQHASPKWTEFAEGTNIGIRLGERSGFLVDLDFDCEEARVLARLHCLFGHLPAFGRSSLPGDATGHRLAICRDAPQKIKKIGFNSAKAKELANALEFPNRSFSKSGATARLHFRRRCSMAQICWFGAIRRPTPYRKCLGRNWRNARACWPLAPLPPGYIRVLADGMTTASRWRGCLLISIWNRGDGRDHGCNRRNEWR